MLNRKSLWVLVLLFLFNVRAEEPVSPKPVASDRAKPAPGAPDNSPKPDAAVAGATSATAEILPAVTVTGETITTATRTEEKTAQVPQSVNVVTHEDIERKQARTPNQMLREETGIWSTQVTAQGSPIIRGQIGNRILYMWDGIRLNNGALFGGPNGNFNQFPIGAVDRIEVVRGPGSVAHGSDAVGGVINIISKKGEFLDERDIGGEAYSRYGSVDNQTTETLDFHLLDKCFAFTGGLTKQDAGDYFAGGGEGKQGPNGFNSLGGYANFAYRPTENQMLRLSWIQNRRDDIDNYGQSKLNANGVPRIFGPTERRGIVKFDYSVEDLCPVLSKDLTFYAYDQYYDALRDRRVQSATTFNTTETQTHQDVYGIGLQNVANLDSHKFTYGVDYRNEDLSAANFLTSRKIASGAITDSIPAGKTPDGVYDVFDAFALGEFKLCDCWNLSAGVRFERDHIHSTPVLTDVIPNAGYDIDSLKINRDWSSVTWSLGTIYNVTHDLDLAADISTSFRAPTYSDLLSAGAPVFASKIASVPSPTLIPEKGVTYEFGPRYHTEKWNLSLTGYWTQLRDLVAATYRGTVDIPGQGTFTRSQNSNSSHGYDAGVEFAAAYKPVRDWTIFGNATYTRGQDHEINQPFRFIPPLNGVVGLRYEAPSKRWWVEGVEMIADRLRRPAPGDQLDSGFSFDPAYGSPNTTNNPPLRRNFQIPGWAITNLRAGVNAWREGRRSFDVTLDIENAFDARYREAYSQQQKFAPGINAVIGGRLKF